VEILNAKTLSQFHHSLAVRVLVHFRALCNSTCNFLTPLGHPEISVTSETPTSSHHHIIMGDNENDYSNSENEFWLFGYGYGTK
jgi:hypothetical protein